MLVEKTKRRWLVVVAIFVLAVAGLLLIPSAAAADGTVLIGEGTEMHSPEGPVVIAGEDIEADMSDPLAAPDTIQIDGYATVSGSVDSHVVLSQTDRWLVLDDVDGEISAETPEIDTVSIDGSASVQVDDYAIDDGSTDLQVDSISSDSITVTFSGLPDGQTIELVDETEGVIDVALSGSDGEATFAVPETGEYQLQFSDEEIAFEDPQPEDLSGFDDLTDTQLEITVDHPSFAVGDVDIIFRDGDDDIIDEQTADTPGTYSTTWSNPPDIAEWYVEMDDGNTVESSEVFGFYDRDGIEITDPHPEDNGAVDSFETELSALIEHPVHELGGETDWEIEGRETETGTIGSDQRVEQTLTGPDETEHWTVSVTHDEYTVTETYAFWDDREVSFTDPEPADGDLYEDDISSIDLALTVDHPALDLVDEIDVSVFAAEEHIGSDTITERDERITITYDDVQMGVTEWYYETNVNEYTTESQTFSFETPNQVEVRDESTDEIIDVEDEVQVRFYNGDRVITRSTADGTVDMSGLSADQRYFVVASLDGYYDRSIVVRDITDQQKIYMLNRDESAVQPIFQLDDKTGEFGAGDRPQLVIERPVSQEEEAGYEVIFGDKFGADGEISPHLKEDERFRLSVENDDGDQRSLGSYTATDDALIQLEIGSLSIDAGEDGWRLSVSESEIEDSDQIELEIEYIDEKKLTENIELKIHQRNNPDAIEYGPVSVSETNNWRETIEIEDGNYELTATIDRDGEKEEVSRHIGGVGDLDLPISGSILQALGLLSLILIGALFGGTMARTGAVVVAVIAWPMTWMGIISVAYPMLLIATTVAVLFRIGSGSSTVQVPIR